MSSSTFKYPALTNEGGLSLYLEQIKKFPMLDAEEEYMLAKNWKNTGNVCLLYTSPSPRDLWISRMPSSA